MVRDGSAAFLGSADVAGSNYPESKGKSDSAWILRSELCHSFASLVLVYSYWSSACHWARSEGLLVPPGSFGNDQPAGLLDDTPIVGGLCVCYLSPIRGVSIGDHGMREP